MQTKVLAKLEELSKVEKNVAERSCLHTPDSSNVLERSFRDQSQSKFTIGLYLSLR